MFTVSEVIKALGLAHSLREDFKHHIISVVDELLLLELCPLVVSEGLSQAWDPHWLSGKDLRHVVEVESDMMRGQFKEFCHAVRTLSDEVPSEGVKDPPQESFGTIHHQPKLVWVNRLELFENLLCQ